MRRRAFLSPKQAENPRSTQLPKNETKDIDCSLCFIAIKEGGHIEVTLFLLSRLDMPMTSG